MNILMLSALNIDTENLSEFSVKSFHSTPWIFNLIDGLISLKNNVTLVTWSGRIKKNYTYQDKSLKIYLLKSPSKFSQIFTGFKVCSTQLKSIVDIKEFDVVHSHDAHRSTIVSLWLKKPLVVTIHGTMREHYSGLERDTIFDIQYIQDKIIEKYILHKIKHAICVSPEVEEKVNILNNKIKTYQVDNAISKEYFKNYNPKYENEILFIGSITVRKQLDILVKAIKKIPEAKLKVIYQYKDEQYYENIIKYIIEKQFQERVLFLGFRDKKGMIKELQKASLLILPSRYESFGMVLAEAMSIGIPVIGTRIAGIPHLIEEEKTGFLINVGDVKDLTNKINLLIHDKQKVQNMGRDARNVALKRWHPEIIAKKTLKVYKQVIND